MRDMVKGTLAPYDFVVPGFEAVFVGRRDLDAAMTANPEGMGTYRQDIDGNVIEIYSLWNCTKGEEDWDDEIKYINSLQARLGPLDDNTRRIAASIASLTPCDNGVPITVDELLLAACRT